MPESNGNFDRGLRGDCIDRRACFANKAVVEAGPRLRITLIPDGMTIGAGPRFDETDLIIVTVTNRGEAPTMITNLLVFEFANRS